MNHPSALQRRVEREMEMEASQWRESSRRRLASDLTTLRRDIEDYLTAYAGQTGEAVVSGRERLLASIAAARQRLSDLEREATGAADALVHEKAWQAIAVAAGLGFIAGWVTARLRL